MKHAKSIRELMHWCQYLCVAVSVLPLRNVTGHSYMESTRERCLIQASFS